MLHINIPAVLMAVVVNFIINFVWYVPLFGKIWGREMGYDPNVKLDHSLMIKGLIYTAIWSFLFAWVFAHNNAAWSFVPGMNEFGKTASALNAAIFTWLGFYVPGHLAATVWEKKSWTLTAINAGYHLVSLLVVAFILIYWV